mgnify:CR=1 FL=1|jgi:hypothetical protein
MVGTELKKLLARAGIHSQPACECHARQVQMDRMGIEWCEQNIETIVEWLKQEATSRGLPFFATAGRMLVRRAIHNARKEAQRAEETT